MGIVREISPELDPVEFPENMDESAVDAFMAQRGQELRQGLIARRQAQLAAETEGDEALRYREGGVPFSERVGSTILAAPQSAMRQTGQTLRGLGEFLATAPIPRERGEIAPEIVRENIRRAQRAPAQVERDVEASPTRRLGGEMVAAAPEAFPTLPGVRESLPSQVSGGIGSVGALLPAGLTGPAAPFVGGAMYGLSAGEDFADDAEQVINSRIAEALAQGNTEVAADLERRKFDMKNTARMAGRAIGAGTEGVLGLAGKIRVGKSQIGGIGARLAERMIPKTAPVAVQNAVRGAVEGGLTEAAQEGTEQILGNAAALAVYDPNRGIMDDVAQSVLVGGLTGNVVGGAFGSRGQNRDPLPASRAAVAGEVVPGTEIPQDIGAPDLTLEDLGDLLPVEEVAAQPESRAAQPETPVVAEATVPEAGPEPATETPAVDSQTLSPATAAETPTAPETPASPAPSSSAEGVTGEKPKRTRKAKRVAIDDLAGVEAAVAPAPVAPVVAPTPAILPDDTAMEAATAAATAPRTPAPVTTAPDEGIAERAAVDEEMTRATTRVPEVAPAQVGMPDEGIAPTQMAQTNPEPEAQSLTPKQYHKAINAWRAKEYGVPVSEVEENYSEESNKQDHWSAVNKFVERGGKLDSKILDSLDEEQIQYLQRSARASIPEGYLSPAVRAKNKAFEHEMIDARKRGREEAKRVVPTLTESQRRYEAAKAKLDALGPEPRKPSNERQRFGTQGRAKASPEAVARYDAEVKAYKNWRAKYSKLKKAEVAASNEVYREDPGYFDRRRAAAAATPEPTITEAPAAEPPAAQAAEVATPKNRRPGEQAPDVSAAARDANESLQQHAKQVVEVVEPLERELRKADSAVAEIGMDWDSTKPGAKKRKTQKSIFQKYNVTTKDELNALYKERVKTANELRGRLDKEKAKAAEMLRYRNEANEAWTYAVEINKEIAKQQKEDEAEFAKEGKLTQEQSLDLNELGLAAQKKRLGVLSEARLAWLESKAAAQAATQGSKLKEPIGKAESATEFDKWLEEKGIEESQMSPKAGDQGVGTVTIVEGKTKPGQFAWSKETRTGGRSALVFRLNDGTNVAWDSETKTIHRVEPADVDANPYYTPAPAAEPAPKQQAEVSTPEVVKRDEEYAAAVKRGNVKAAQEMVDEAAKQDGYNIGTVWHGTGGKQITKFTGTSWFSSKRGLLSRYGGERGVIGAKIKLQKPLDLTKDKRFDMDALIDAVDVYKAAGLPDPPSAKYQYGRPAYQTVNSPEFIKAAKLKGYDGIKVRENNTVTYAVFDPKNVKSADPITKDDAGNVIALSRRFDSSSPDIRGSQSSGLSSTTGKPQPDIIQRALDAKEDRMAQPMDSDQSSEPLSDELISKFTETDGYGFTEVKPELLLEQISSGEIKLKPVRAALLAHLLKPDSRHKLKEIELVKSKEFSGRFNTRRNSNVGTIQISTVYKDGSPVSVNHFAHALTHELVHNAVTSKLDESPQFKARAKSLYDYVKEKTPGTKWADSYAMSNLSEFFAEGMANSGFRKFLLGIEYPVTMRTPGMPSTGRLSAFGGMLYLLKQALNLPKFIYDKFTGQQVEAITALDELIDVAQRLESRQRIGSQAMMGFMEASNPPAIERALNAAIKATDRTSATFSDPFLIAAVGLPVLNAALRIVRRVYLKTRDLARAKRQGMRLIRRQLRTDPKADLPRIEEAFNQLVEGTAERPGPDQIEAFQAADGTRRQKSRGLFTGDVTVDTDAEWQAGAERWINQFNGNIRRAFEAARSTDYATTGLNPAAQDYVFGRLLELTEIQANAARNDVDALRALNLQKEIADAMRLASSEAGKALGARALVQNRLLWMFPVLNYRNLIREAQKRLPFPDVVADEVRTWLQESGRRAVQEMRNAMTDADKVFARELKTTVRDMRVVWRDVMTASVESQEAMRRKILEELVKAPELKGLSRQGYIDIANLLGKAWERERARIFAAEFRKQVPLPTVKEDVRRKLFTAIPDILKWANLGLLDNEAFRNAVAPKFGVAKFDGETAKKLNTMAQQAQRVGGVNRNRIIAEMYDTMQREGGVRWPDIVRDYWYAAVLGAVNTQVDNALGVINGALNTVMGMAMSPPEVRKAMGKAYREGFGEAIADFFPILWRGDVARAINFNPEQPANTLNALSKSGNLFARGLSVGKYVSRLMTALDQINALSTDQAMKAYALGRRLPVEHVRRYMMPSENVLRTARLKAEAEGTPPNLMRKRVREIVQESIPVEVLISSKEIRELVTFTNQPKGLMGALYRGVQEMEKKAPGFKVLSGTNFLRFAANYSNEILNYVAPVALYRYYVSAPSRAGGRLGLKMGQEERQLILAKLAVGTALGTFAAALFLGDDDDEKDRKIDITGSFKSLDPNKRKQLLSEGRAPYSIRIGDKYVSYRQLPFGGVLGAIGELRDRQLYNPQEWDQESIARKFVDGAFAGSLIVRDSPAISSFTEFLGTANAYKYDMNEQVEKSLPKYIARLGGSFIPRIAKEIDAWADPAIYKANTGHEFFLQQMPIFRRELGEGPVLNVLGEPVQVERYPWSRWIKTRKEDKAWSTLGELASKGVFLPVPSVTVKVLENGKRREMTPFESYRYQQRVGQAYRKFVEDNAERLLRMKPDEATDFIDTQTERIRSRIRAGGA